MFVEVDNLVKFCVKHDLNVEQVLLCYILYLDKIEGTKFDIKAQAYNEGGPNIANVYRYTQSEKGASGQKRWPTGDIEDLAQKGFIENNNQKSPTGRREMYPDKIEVTDKFIDAVMSDQSLFDEFWSEYPAFTDNFENPRTGNRIPLKGVSKGDVFKEYSSQIKNRNMHHRLMRGLRIAVEKNEINMRIDKWLAAEYWKEYIKENATGENDSVQQAVR